MFTKPGQIDLSRLSLDSLSMEQPLEQDDSDIELSYSEKSNRLVAKRYFQFYHQTIADIRQSPINLTPWIFSMIFFAAAYMIVAKLRFFGALNTSYCSPDGSIKPVYTNLWATSDLFQVNIATGNLTFTQAKVIDTIWDLIVGRGGQATLTLITWKLFAEYAAVSMAIQPVTFATYRILFTDSGPSISSTASLLYDFIKFRGLASKWASAFLIYSIMLSLAFPTLAGSTTGYTTLNEAFIHTDDNNLIPISSPSWGDMTNPNETYESVIRRQGVCVPVKDRYQWGASFLQALFLIEFIVLWIIGCLVLVLSSHARYRVAKDTEIPEGYQAMGILVGSIDEQLTESNVKAYTTSDQLLKNTIKTELGGGSISFGTLTHTSTFRQWLAGERIWLVGLCILVASVLASGIYTLLRVAPYEEEYIIDVLCIPILFWLSLGTLYAILVGRTSKSRLFLILCWTVLGVGISVGFLSIPL